MLSVGVDVFFFLQKYGVKLGIAATSFRVLSLSQAQKYLTN